VAADDAATVVSPGAGRRRVIGAAPRDCAPDFFFTDVRFFAGRDFFGARPGLIARLGFVAEPERTRTFARERFLADFLVTFFLRRAPDRRLADVLLRTAIACSF